MDTRAETATSSPVARRNRPRRLRRIAIAFVGLLAAGAIAWFLFVPDPVAVELTRVAQGPMQVSVDNQGQVRVHDRYIVAAPVAAELQRIDLHDGDPVRRNQVVAVLDPLPMDARQRQETAARVESASALAREAGLQVQRAYTDLQLAIREHERVRQLVESRFVSPQAEEKAVAAEQAARATWNAARSREDAAQADVKAARAALASADLPAAAPGRELKLTAPVDGYVLKVLERSARTVAAGTQLVSIADPSQYEIVVDVLSTDAVKIRPGDAMLLDDWGGGRVLRAQVKRVEPVAFTKISALGVEEQRVNVLGAPIDPLGPLGDGYRIEARIVIWSDDKALKVAGSSLFRVGDAWHVFVAEDGRARERTVTVGRRNQDEAQILSGLSAGTPVIRYPSNQLQDGARIAAAPGEGAMP